MAAVAAGSVSVVVTSFNQKEYLAEAIESVLRQTVRPLEIIVADDASTDGSQVLIESLARRHPDLIVPIFQARNLGMVGNRNSGLANARGAYVTLLDGDDRSVPTKHERELEALARDPSAKIAYSKVWFLDSAGQRTGLRTQEAEPSGDIFRYVFGRCFPHYGTIRDEMVAAECYRTVGFQDPQFAFSADWDLRVRLTRRFRVAHCAEPLCEYRKHPGGNSFRSGVGVLYLELRAIIRKNLGLLEGLPVEDVAFIRKAHVREQRRLLGPAAREAIVSLRPRLLAECARGWWECRGCP